MKYFLIFSLIILSSCSSVSEIDVEPIVLDDEISIVDSNSGVEVDYFDQILFMTDARNMSQIVSQSIENAELYDGTQNMDQYRELLIIGSDEYLKSDFNVELEHYELVVIEKDNGQRLTYARFDYGSELRKFLSNSSLDWQEISSSQNILEFMIKKDILIITNYIENSDRLELLNNSNYNIDVISFADTFRLYAAGRIIIINQSNRLSLDVNHLFNQELDFTEIEVVYTPENSEFRIEYINVPSSGEAKRIFSNIESLLDEKIIDRDLVLLIATIQLTPIADFRSDLDICRLQTDKTHPDGSQLGFPYIEPFIPNRGEVNVIVAPIDFPNYRGDSAYLTGLKEDVTTIDNWANFFSGGDLKYNLTVLEEWTFYPKGHEYLPVYGNSFYNELQDTRITKVEILELLSQKTDITNVDMVYLIFPSELLREKRVTLYGRDNLRLSNGTVLNVAFYGNERFENEIGTYWNHLLHETMHFQGFVGHGPGRNFDSSYSVMNNADGGAVGILSWEAFLVNWFDDEDIHCISKNNLDEPVNIYINSIDQLGASGGAKSVMVPLTETKILIIENRTGGQFSLLRNYRQGIISYVVDISKSSLYPNGPSNQLELDKVNFWYHMYSNPEDLNPVFSIGQYFEYEGVRVRVVDENIVEISAT